MASYELQSFAASRGIYLVAAVEDMGAGVIRVGFWLRDPENQVIFPERVLGHPRHDFLWQHTCFEVFFGVEHEDGYREVNLSPTQAWQAYQFEEYRYPEQMPPLPAYDIELLKLERTHYGLSATIDLSMWLQAQQLSLDKIYMGMSAVIKTAQQEHLFAMQHSGRQADFHNKRDWTHRF